MIYSDIMYRTGEQGDIGTIENIDCLAVFSPGWGINLDVVG
jgi:hypothetical protein